VEAARKIQVLEIRKGKTKHSPRSHKDLRAIFSFSVFYIYNTIGSDTNCNLPDFHCALYNLGDVGSAALGATTFVTKIVIIVKGVVKTRLHIGKHLFFHYKK